MAVSSVEFAVAATSSAVIGASVPSTMTPAPEPCAVRATRQEARGQGRVAHRMAAQHLDQ